jgi:hypothetical protein
MDNRAQSSNTVQRLPNEGLASQGTNSGGGDERGSETPPTADHLMIHNAAINLG